MPLGQFLEKIGHTSEAKPGFRVKAATFVTPPREAGLTAGITFMPCIMDVDSQVQVDILECDADVRKQIGDFLLALQENPLPAERRKMGSSAFYLRLAGGYYIA